MRAVRPVSPCSLSPWAVSLELVEPVLVLGGSIARLLDVAYELVDVFMCLWIERFAFSNTFVFVPFCLAYFVHTFVCLYYCLLLWLFACLCVCV